MDSKSLYITILFLLTLIQSQAQNGQTLKPLPPSGNSENGISQSESNLINHEFCGADFTHNLRMKNDVQYKAHHLKTNQALKKMSEQKKAVANGVMQIPVVLVCEFLEEESNALAHEMGHAFNLLHTFHGDNPNTNTCGDDGISDTPKHIRTSSMPGLYFGCNMNRANTCDLSFDEIINPDTGFRRSTGTHKDHMHNYMDYILCASEFTGGQRTVALAALNGPRASFLTSPALTPPVEIGDTFIADHITYQITSLAPLEVTAIGYNTAGGPNVTSIGGRAFANNRFISVML